MGAFAQVASVIDVKLGQGIIIDVRPSLSRGPFTPSTTPISIGRPTRRGPRRIGRNLPLAGLAIRCYHGRLRDESRGESGAG